MENNASKDQNFVDNEHEEIPESFVCCVCLDLLYKPIVLSCGHISCFWCVHKSMNTLCESHCPICRHPYYHFPTVCQMLHFLLLKIFPAVYKRRENQTLEEENETGFYSPQFDADTGGSQAKFGHSASSSSCSIVNPVSNSCNVGPSECMEESGCSAHKEDEGILYSEHMSNGASEFIRTPSAEGKKLSQNGHHRQLQISLSDVMCTMCNQLLFHPVVLNCGHVYCESCIINLPDEVLRCHTCQSPHPTGFPKVCLELDNFLEEQFPEEYAQRRDSVQLMQIKVKRSLDNGNKGEKMPSWSDPDSKVHVGCGCDFCGIYPIIGDRYKCIDCKEKTGFDLCGDCYKTRSKLPGRFNQQHTLEHRFEHVQPDIIRNIMLRLVTGRLGNSSIDTESSENLEFTSEDPMLFDVEDIQNDSEATN